MRYSTSVYGMVVRYQAHVLPRCHVQASRRYTNKRHGYQQTRGKSLTTTEQKDEAYQLFIFEFAYLSIEQFTVGEENKQKNRYFCCRIEVADSTPATRPGSLAATPARKP